MNRYRVAVTFVLIVAVVGIVGYVVFSGDLRVTVENDGQHAMKDVTIHVTGKSYFLGDLGSGDSATHAVSPVGESHVEVEFIGDKGRRVRLNAGGYLEARYKGRMVVRIKDEKVKAVTDTVRIGPY